MKLARRPTQRSSPLSLLERLSLFLAPRWTLERMRARVTAGLLARHYEAASFGRRTSGWARNRGDANAINGVALAELRLHARDLVRNNGWAKNALRIIANHTTGGWGITPRPGGKNADAASALWKAWAESTECESGGRLTFYALQALAMRSMAESGEVLIRRRPRRLSDGLTVPLQLQVLEADFLDTAKDGLTGQQGGPIIQGVEFDAIGRRVAYWLFPEHPGSGRAASTSRRIPAEEVLHIHLSERPGQARGVSWFGAAIVSLKDLDEYEDATLVRQKIAACFAAFVTDAEGDRPVGEPDAADELVETFEPGMIQRLPPGKDISFANPPNVLDEGFTNRNLRRVAKALGVTYEDMTGDYSGVNFSSARLARIEHYLTVRDWQWSCLIPLLCQGVWAWFVDAAITAGQLPGVVADYPADWTTPPMPMIEPDREGLAYQRLLRNGVITHNEMIREQGGDPRTHWEEYANGLKELDRLGIKLDSDVRAVSQAGLTQERAGSQKAPSSPADGEADPATQA